MKKTIVFSLSLLLCLIACKEEKKDEVVTSTTVALKTKISPKDFEGIVEGDSVKLYVLTNKNGLEVTFTNYGQRVISLHVPDKNGKFEDVVLGYATLDEYLNSPRSFFGSIVGRYGNRIANGSFSIGENTYSLAKNNNGNHLHGGDKGFESVVWKVDNATSNSIDFSRTSPDMEEGYPGNLDIKVSYALTDDNELKIKYQATTDKPTVVNLTHHSFFNLKGEGNGDINDHVLMINADGYTPVDDGLIPTGEIDKVADTPFDFTKPKTIGVDLEEDFEQLKMGNGYDHNFVLNDTPKNDDGLVLCAKVLEPISGRTMEVFTDEPGVQFYGGNFMDGTTIGKSGKPYVFRGSFCLETQHFPDSPNKPDFPSTLLEPGEVYTSNCTYKFGVSAE
ncbi:galactose mutarotase [Maribacter algarum]|uniref:Aldose 1-epimerase n=1 Tax=Maribacter algarum (ex Zhang et al. 2020) TaxID=2578118 RepID=A0A5S3PS27_9FLAO|nr:aldose epimerase family protein [Maribacter algarum]TMM57512.1 galactose mutarotase [Maribacter algarum]